ncbi:MAG: hypothetical protein LJE74_03690 [Proteobacteria bacterium]|jgi:hypothetical protein|nr:hypothetical protein [Pseudomonadota bacterium]
MPKPTEQELEQALTHAGRMRETGEDPHFLAKALLSCHYLNGYLVDVLRAAEDYIRTGLSEQEHTRLIKAIEKARAADDRSARVERPGLGL